MIGITATAAYTPAYRLARRSIAEMWKTADLGGERSVARHDEDSLTMAVEAALKCLRLSSGSADGVFFSSTTPPYREKQTAALLSAALDLPTETRTNDFSDSIRAGTIAVAQAVDAVKSGSAEQVVVAASDCRLTAGKSDNEQLVGDGAAAASIGSRQVIASIEGRVSLYSAFTDSWRREGGTHVKTWENRFVASEGYARTLRQAMVQAMEKYRCSAKDFSRVIYNGPDLRSHAGLARTLGFEPEKQVQDPLIHSIGNTGTAAVFMMLDAVLETAAPGDLLLLANYGDGADVFILRVTDHIKAFQEKRHARKAARKQMAIDYETYLAWRNLIPYEEARHPENDRASIPCAWREQKSILPFFGSRCTSCAAVQYPPQRVCTRCGAKDVFEAYKLSDQPGHVFTYAVDQLSWGKERPLLVGIVDFKGGGRVMCEICDCPPEAVHIGMPVEMCFRKMGRSSEFETYFWKARPV